MNMSHESTSLAIRAAQLSDAEIVIAFNAAMALETEHRQLPLESLRPGVNAAIQDAARCRYFVATWDEVVVGQAMVTFEWSDWRNGWLWWLQSVYVAPDYRRRGIFRELYDHVRRAAHTAGDCCGLRLYVEHENHAAQATYQQLGMKSAGYLVFEEIWRE